MEIEEYNLIEERNQKKLSNKVIESFSPIHFEKSGYPIRIKDYEELGRYIDVMQENRYLSNLKILGYSSDEDEKLIKKISNDINKFARNFNIFSFGKNILTRSLISKRIHDLFLNKGDSVLEIGPGSGYYASICYENQIKYYGIEITQALYLYQSNFYFNTYRNDYANYAKKIENKKINHIPWWIWANENLEFKINIITANHVLCEMHPNSLLFTFKKAINLFQNSNEKIIICEGAGSRRFSSPEHVVYLMNKIGWRLVHTVNNIYIFIHTTSSHEFKNKMSFRRKINFKYLRYLVRHETKNIFSILSYLLKFIFKKDCYYHNLEIRSLNNFDFSKPNISPKKIKNIDNIDNIFSAKNDDDTTKDEKFLNYININ